MKLYGNDKDKTPAEKKQTAGGKGRTALIVSLALVAVILVAAVVGMTLVNRLDTIYPKVTMNGIDLGGKTLEEAAETLRAAGYDEHTPIMVSVAMPSDYTLTLSSDDVCTYATADSEAYLAYSACRMDFDALTYLKCLFGGMKLESPHEIPRADRQAILAAVESAAAEVRLGLMESGTTFDETSICILKGAQNVEINCEELTEMIIAAFVKGEDADLVYEAEIVPNAEMDFEELYASVYAERADASYSAEGGIVPEVVGVRFDIAEAQKLWDAAAYGEKVYIPLIFDEPEVTAAGLESTLFRDKLSEMTTSLWGSTDNRVNNVSKAAASINDIILMPGDEFDYNKALGKRTAENGYQLAGAYSGGQTVQEYGGGICQVSSTLYYCCLYANLEITARTCHMFPVAYLPAGLDATVSWGGPEYRFVNNREYPIRIVAYVAEDGKSVTVELWGTDVDGSYVEMSYGTWFVYDETYPEVAIGYKAQTYRSVFDKDGNLISREREAYSTYNYHPEDIKWPEEPEETEEPTESPEPTENPEPTDPPTPTEPVTPTEPTEPTPETPETPPVTEPVEPAPETPEAPPETPGTGEE